MRSEAVMGCLLRPGFPFTVPAMSCLTLTAALLLPARLIAQTIPLAGKLTSLEGRWSRDSSRGTRGGCEVPYAADVVELSVSPTEVRIQTNWFNGAFKLDGSETTLSDGRRATAARDAGWLAVTIRRDRQGGATNVMREVFILNGSELTIWRTLNVVMADGTQGEIGCGNHQAIVYTKSLAR
jgi:hypothetical protein